MRKKNLKDWVEQNWLLTLIHPLQVGSHEERAEGEGDTAAGCNQKPFLQKPAGPEGLADPRARAGDQQEGKHNQMTKIKGPFIEKSDVLSFRFFPRERFYT